MLYEHGSFCRRKKNFCFFVTSRSYNVAFLKRYRKLKLAEPPAKFIGLAATVVADEEESSTSVDTSDSDSYAYDVHHGSKSDTESELLPSGDESIKS
jgi:hypothetical protein